MTHEHEDIETFPPFPFALIDALEKHYRYQPPSPTSTQREDLYHAGQRSVILFLRRVQEDQSERAHEQWSQEHRAR